MSDHNSQKPEQSHQSSMGAFTAKSEMKRQSLGRVLKQTWKIAAPYWTQSEERFVSWLLLALNLAITGLGTFVGLRMTIWTADWTNALVNRDVMSWQLNIWVFLVIGISMTITTVLGNYLTAWILIRWRRWMTARYLRMWLDQKAHYKMTLSGNETDNPDQRISQDVAEYIMNTWTLIFDFVRIGIMQLFTFGVVLWGFSDVPLVFGGRNLEFPGYLIVMSLIWAVITTFISHLNGKRMSRINYDQQRYEANFRYSLVRVRENSEQIALLRGEGVEHTRMMSVFGDCVVNTFRNMGVNLRFGTVTTMMTYVDAMMFTLVLGPAWLWLGGIEDYGTFQLIATAFMNVVNSLKWFQTQYIMLAQYVAVADRLYAFNENHDKMQKITAESKLVRQIADTNSLSVDNLKIDLPNGNLQVSADHIKFNEGERVLIKGRTGAGKTTLFRAISGIWPYAEGHVTLPKDKKTMILPQRPYFPIGTLEEAISYPAPAGTYKREDVKQAIIDVGLEYFADRIDEIQHWNLVMSGGEQQRIGIARALLYKPDFVFFDEATASMDEPSELDIYNMLLERLSGAAIISIGHRSSLQQFHDRLLFAEGAVPGKPVAPYHFEEQSIDKATQYFAEEKAEQEKLDPEKNK